MQHSAEYVAYRKMLARKRRLWASFFILGPAIMFALVFFSGDSGGFVAFPVMLILILIWKYFLDQNDTCPWCEKSFSYSWYGDKQRAYGVSGSAGPRCANCGQPSNDTERQARGFDSG